jgi:hypothetical protein
MHFTNSSSYHLGGLLINLQYSQKFLCGDIGGRGGKDIHKEIMKSIQIVLPRAYLGNKSFKLMKREYDDA